MANVIKVLKKQRPARMAMYPENSELDRDTNATIVSYEKQDYATTRHVVEVKHPELEGTVPVQLRRTPASPPEEGQKCNLVILVAARDWAPKNIEEQYHIHKGDKKVFALL